MASVHRIQGSPYYHAFFRIPNGKQRDGSIKWLQVRRSTKRESRDEAFAAAVEMERAAMVEAGAEWDKSRQFLSVLREAADDAARGNLTEAMARDYLEKITELATGKAIQSHSIEGWLTSWLSDKKRSKSTGTAVRYEGVIQAFLRSVSKKALAPLTALSVENIRVFRDAELDSGKSPATVNLAVKTVSMALNQAKRQGILKVNPAEAVDRIRSDAIEKGTFADNDVRALLSVTDAEWKGVILCAYFTGARLHDITNLTWKNIHLEKGTLTFTASKTQKGIEIPLHPTLKDFLMGMSAPDDDDVPLFPSLAGKSTSGHSGLSMAFARIMKLAKLTGKITQAKGSKGRSRSSLSFHSLRHSFTSNLARAGVPSELRQKLTGHLDAKTHQRYTHHELVALQQAVEKLPSL